LQTCTRFVAQAFANADIHLVDDADFCTPEELLTSKLLMLVDNVLVKASEQDIEIANSSAILPELYQKKYDNTK